LARARSPCRRNSVTPLASPVFTDLPLQQSITVIRAVHINELRQRIDAQRVRFGLPLYMWTDPVLTIGLPIRAVHVLDLRIALGGAYLNAGIMEPPCTDPSLAAGLAIKVEHIAELRAAVAAIE
jgi:hypothetical protein